MGLSQILIIDIDMANHRKKERFEKITIFAYGEGSSEHVLLVYLRSIFSHGKTNPTTLDAGGGSPRNILEKAIRMRSGRGGSEFNKSFILMDKDKAILNNEIDELEKIAKENSFEIIWNSPCLEATLFKILGLYKNNMKSKTSRELKNDFKNFINEEKYVCLNKKICKKYFTKDILKSAMKRVEELKRIIEILTGNF